MQKLYIDYIEFYITHVCNLACNGCNRFNDRKLVGTQKWKDYKSIYKKWSEQLDIGYSALMGGEPLLNGTLYEWVDGITTIWPNLTLEIVSNGFLLPKHKRLYQYLLNKKVKLEIGVHNKIHTKKIVKNVEDFLEGSLTYEFDNTPYRNKLVITDSNNVRIQVSYNWWFHQGAIIKKDGYETLHNSDVLIAHNNCHSKTCHHFDKGRLYKCGPSALFSQYDEQKGLVLSEEDRKLIKNVKSICVEDSFSTKQEFLQKIKDPIPQCKFCPEVYHGDQIFAQEKKNLIASV